MKPVNNSTLASWGLTKEEVRRLRLANFGTKPARAKAGTTKASKARYIADIERRAGVTPAAASQSTTEHLNDGEQDLKMGYEDSMLTLADDNQELRSEDKELMLMEDDDDQDLVAGDEDLMSTVSDDKQDSEVADEDLMMTEGDENQEAPEDTTSAADSENEDEQELEVGDEHITLAEAEPADRGWRIFCMDTYADIGGDDADGFVEGPLGTIQDINKLRSESPAPEGRRFDFLCSRAPFLVPLTEQEALLRHDVDMSDPRIQMPRSAIDHQQSEKHYR